MNFRVKKILSFLAYRPCWFSSHLNLGDKMWSTLGLTDKFASRYVVQYVCLPVLCSFCTAGKSCLLPPVVTLKWFSSHFLRPAAPPRPHRSHSHSHRRGWKIIRLWYHDRIFVNWWDGIRATFCRSTVARSALDQYWKMMFLNCDIFLLNNALHILDDYY